MRDVPFHPLVAGWFRQTFAEPTAIQTQGWRHIAAGADTLIAAPTGSGKTLAAFLWALNDLVERGLGGRLEDRIHVVYVSPLKALGNDIQKNLQAPLAGIRSCRGGRRHRAAGDPRRGAHRRHAGARARAAGAAPAAHPDHDARVALHPAHRRAQPRAAGATPRRVIVDEIHAVAADKRGAHLALSLERLDALAGRRLQRIGLSATQKPIDEVARLLVGAGRMRRGRRAALRDRRRRPPPRARSARRDARPGARRRSPATSCAPRSTTASPRLVRAHRTTIVFVNTRRLVERVAHALGERLGDEQVAAHHGSMSRELRLAAEDGLKRGAVPVVVATASLELGIDVGHVDLVCQLGAPRSIATLLQRVGRSGHSLGAMPKGILFPLTRDELVQCAAAVRAVEAGELDRLDDPGEPARHPRPADRRHRRQRAARSRSRSCGHWCGAPIRSATCARPTSTPCSRCSPRASRRGAAGARRTCTPIACTAACGRGAARAWRRSPAAAPFPTWPTTTSSRTPPGALVGKVNEDFAIESMAGDIFLLGNRSWRIRRVEAGRMRVVDAAGRAADDAVLARRGAGAHGRAVGGGRRLRREVAARARRYRRGGATG